MKLRQLLPLLAATQLGGDLRHAAIPVLPMIYDFLGISTPTPQVLVDMSKQIEPQVKLGRRTRKEAANKPLPFMFQ